LRQGQADIQLLNVTLSVPAVDYKTIHVTIVEGLVNASWFGVDQQELPDEILTMRGEKHPPLLNSLSVLQRGNNFTISKIFSPAELSDDVLSALYQRDTVQWVHKTHWKAYPQLAPLTQHTYTSPLLADNVYYVNSFEPVVSTMETESWSGWNVARLVAESWMLSPPVHPLFND
jgi:prenylcysteine oxidase/farnesylcysteine lyase